MVAGPTATHQLPGIPSGLTVSQREFLNSIKQILEIGEGQRGDPLDRKVTERDLIDIGLATLKRSAIAQGGSTSARIESSIPLPNRTVPPAVADFTASGAYSVVVLSWGPPTYGNHGLVEIRRSSNKNFGQAVEVALAPGRTSVDTVGGGFVGYYWAANVSDGGVRGPWTGPVKAETTPDFEFISGAISSTEWQADTSYGLFTAIAPTTPVFIGGVELRLVSVSAGDSAAVEPNWGSIAAFGDTITDNEVVWQAVEVGKIPLFIDPVTGLVVIEGAAIKEASVGALKVEDAFLDNLTVAKGVLNFALIDVGDIFNLNIGNVIQSDNFIAGVQGWRAQKGGAMELNDGLVVNAGAVIDTAQIVDAAVDTLQLAGQAVTFPKATSTSGDTGIAGSYTTYQSLTINATGAPIVVTASFSHWNNHDLSNVGGESHGDAEARLLRGGIVIANFPDIAQTGFFAASTTVVYDSFGFGSFCAQVQDTPPVPGSVTYELQVRSPISKHRIAQRVLSALEVKR